MDKTMAALLFSTIGAIGTVAGIGCLFFVFSSIWTESTDYQSRAFLTAIALGVISFLSFMGTYQLKDKI